MRRRLAVAALLAAVVLLCSPVWAHAEEPTPDDATVEVRIGDNFYKPKRDHDPGRHHVVWRNEGGNEHNVLPDRGQALRQRRARAGRDVLVPLRQAGGTVLLLVPRSTRERPVRDGEVVKARRGSTT